METKENKYRRGQRFSAKIQGISVSGKIQIQEDVVYLCQNEKHGDSCDNKLGYDHSWNVGDGSKEKLKLNNVTNFIVEPSENFIEGDVVIGNSKKEYTVGGVCGQIVFIVDKTDHLYYTGTQKQVVAAGYKLKEEEKKEEVVELTIEDISNGKGVGVAPHLIRIKKGK